MKSDLTQQGGNYLQKLVLCDHTLDSQGCFNDALLTKVILPLHEKGLAREEYLKIKNYNIMPSLAPLPDRGIFGITSTRAMSSSYIVTYNSTDCGF